MNSTKTMINFLDEYESMDPMKLLSGVSTYANKLRRDFLANSSCNLKPHLTDPESEKGEFFFGENVNKQIAEHKATLRNLQETKNAKYPSIFPNGRQQGYRQSSKKGQSKKLSLKLLRSTMTFIPLYFLHLKKMGPSA